MAAIPEQQKVLVQSLVERNDLLSDVAQTADAVDAEVIRTEADSGDDYVRRLARAKVVFAALHMREIDRLSVKQAAREAKVLKHADPSTITAVTDIDIAEQRANKGGTDGQ
jgi:hypothetical protein